jgi:thioredoxin-like negative regulator of GroEL
LEQAVQIYPDSMEAKRRLADFYERTGQRQALALWNEVVRLEPTNPQNLLGLAGTALRFGDWETCRAALGQMRPADKDSSDYYRIAAGLAMITRDNAGLEENLVALNRLNPADLRVQLSLALVHLRSAEGATAENARGTLVKLALTDAMRIRAIVELLGDVARRWPKPAVARVAALEDLARNLTPAVGPRLDITRELDPIERLIGFAMDQPRVEPEDAVSLANWMILNGRAAAALEWIDRLPAKTRDSIMVMTVVAEAALRSQDWTRLHKLIQAGVWGAVPPGTVPRALAAREKRNQDAPAGDRNNWAGAIEASRASLSGLQVLLRLSEAWNWPEERRQVLQAVTQAFPHEAWAWRQLISYALARRDAEQVRQIYQRWTRAQAGDTNVQVEAAIMGLLLQQRGAPAPAETAEFVRLQPKNPAASVAHALALWRAQRPAESLAVLEGLPRPVFQEPRFALAYGLVLAESGRPQESEPMLLRASTGRLLPEEEILIEQARARNGLRRAGH